MEGSFSVSITCGIVPGTPFWLFGGWAGVKATESPQDERSLSCWCPGYQSGREGTVEAH